VPFLDHMTEAIRRIGTATALPLPHGIRELVFAAGGAQCIVILALMGVASWLHTVRCLRVMPGMLVRRTYPFAGSHLALTPEGRKYFWSTEPVADRLLNHLRGLARALRSIVPIGFVSSFVTALAVSAGGQFEGLSEQQLSIQRQLSETRVLCIGALAIAWRVACEIHLRRHKLVMSMPPAATSAHSLGSRHRLLDAYWRVWFPRSLLVTASWASYVAVVSFATLIVLKVSWR
jgi:hypothetical protein